VNLPKFVALDIPLFKGIVGDLFPGSDLSPTDYGSLETCIREEAKARRL
jgi:dynein heavy chain, axonemal